MEDPRQLRDEAAVCRQLAREIDDPRSIAMLIERAEQLEARAAALERHNSVSACEGVGSPSEPWRFDGPAGGGVVGILRRE